MATGKWSVSTADAGSYPRFTPWRSLDAPANLCRPGLLPDFSGTIAYETTFAAEGACGQGVFLDLGQVGETAEVWLNGRALGVRLGRPYVFDVSDCLRAGENRRRAEVTNTLVHELKDDFSRFMAQEPSGLIGPLTLRAVE